MMLFFLGLLVGVFAGGILSVAILCCLAAGSSEDDRTEAARDKKEK